jgi:hypothetical protein
LERCEGAAGVFRRGPAVGGAVEEGRSSGSVDHEQGGTGRGVRQWTAHGRISRAGRSERLDLGIHLAGRCGGFLVKQIDDKAFFTERPR